LPVQIRNASQAGEASSRAAPAQVFRARFPGAIPLIDVKGDAMKTKTNVKAGLIALL
jgi:hypothetical protein